MWRVAAATAWTSGLALLVCVCAAIGSTEAFSVLGEGWLFLVLVLPLAVMFFVSIAVLAVCRFLRRFRDH